MKKTIRNKELLVGVIFLIVGVAYFALAFTIPSYDAYGGSSVVDSSFVPKVIGALMTVLSVLQLVFSLRAGKNPPPAAPSAKPTEEDGTFKVEDWDDDAANRNADTKALIAIFAILIVYMALMSVTPKQKRKLPVIVILSVIVAIGVYYLFVYGLDMVLPAGILG